MANDVRESNVPDSGQWIVQDNAAAVQKGLLDFSLKQNNFKKQWYYVAVF